MPESPVVDSERTSTIVGGWRGGGRRIDDLDITRGDHGGEVLTHTSPTLNLSGDGIRQYHRSIVPPEISGGNVGAGGIMRDRCLVSRGSCSVDIEIRAGQVATIESTNTQDGVGGEASDDPLRAIDLGDGTEEKRIHFFWPFFEVPNAPVSSNL